MMCGGIGTPTAATAEHQEICDKVKSDVQSKTNKSYPTFQAVLVATQLVAGTNYFIKVKVGDREHIHIRVFQTLPHAGSTLELSAVQEGKQETDIIEYFQ